MCYDDFVLFSACQTEIGIPELVLMKELREQCSSPVPSEPSFAFEDDPCDSTFEAPISDSSARWVHTWRDTEEKLQFKNTDISLLHIDFVK